MSDDDASEAEQDNQGRDETHIERLDRNWDELLQELRVTQTGVQILSGFLLTLPFQDRFSDLGEVETAIYLVAVALAAIATVLIIAPVAYHRLLFRQSEKELMVKAGDRFARSGLFVLGLAVSTVLFLVFDVVLGAGAGIAAFVGILALFIGCWVVLPLWSARHT